MLFTSEQRPPARCGFRLQETDESDDRAEQQRQCPDQRGRYQEVTGQFPGVLPP